MVAILILSTVLSPGIEIHHDQRYMYNESSTLSSVDLYMPLYENNHQSKLYNGLYNKISDKILDGYLVVNENFQDVKVDIKNIDWDIEATSSPNTFSLYLHTLRPVYYLTMAYLSTGENDYLDVAENIILSWDKYDNNTNISKNRYTWYDHSVAERTENLILFSA